MKRPRIITDLTGDKPVVYINFEMTLTESQLVEAGLRRLYDPKGYPRSTIADLINAFTKANERVEDM